MRACSSLIPLIAGLVWERFDVSLCICIFCLSWREQYSCQKCLGVVLQTVFVQWHFRLISSFSWCFEQRPSNWFRPPRKCVSQKRQVSYLVNLNSDSGSGDWAAGLTTFAITAGLNPAAWARQSPYSKASELHSPSLHRTMLQIIFLCAGSEWMSPSCCRKGFLRSWLFIACLNMTRWKKTTDVRRSVLHHKMTKIVTNELVVNAGMILDSM